MKLQSLFRAGFATPFEQHRGRIGQPFLVLRRITEDDDLSEAEAAIFDADNLPVYRIRFSDGTLIYAYPEEVEANPVLPRWEVEPDIAPVARPAVDCAA